MLRAVICHLLSQTQTITCQLPTLQFSYSQVVKAMGMEVICCSNS